MAAEHTVSVVPSVAVAGIQDFVNSVVLFADFAVLGIPGHLVSCILEYRLFVHFALDCMGLAANCSLADNTFAVILE